MFLLKPLTNMKVKVLFFGATAEIAGRSFLEIDLDPGSISRAAFDRVLGDYPRLAEHKLLFAVNQEYAEGAEPLKEGDELAVFTAVSGG